MTAAVMTTDSAPGAIAAPAARVKRLPKVVRYTRVFRTTRPVVAGLSDEMVERWANGTLSLSLSKQYQTTREQVEFLIWQSVAPLVRAALRGTRPLAIALAGLAGAEAYHAAALVERKPVAVERTFSRNGRARKRGLEDGSPLVELRVDAAVGA